MQSALKNIAGVSGLKVTGMKPIPGGIYFRLKPKGQIIEYSGSAKPEDVIAILHEKTRFKVKVAKPPKVATPPKKGTTQFPEIKEAK